MSLAITELQLDDVNTISIPTDAILMLSLLIVFALIGYFFHKILDNQTNQFVENVDNNSNLELFKDKLEDQLTLDSRQLNHENLEKPINKKLSFLPPSKLLGLGSLAIVAIGGSSLLGIQAIQNPQKGVKTSQVNIKTETQSAKSLLSMGKLKSSNKSLSKIKKIRYVNSLLSTNNSSKNNNFYKVKEKRREDFFSF